MPAPYHSIEDRLNRYLTGLTNVLPLAVVKR